MDRAYLFELTSPRLGVDRILELLEAEPSDDPNDSFSVDDPEFCKAVRALMFGTSGKLTPGG